MLIVSPTAAGVTSSLWITATLAPTASPGNYTADVVVKSGSVQLLVVKLAVGETAILPHPPLPLVGLSIWMERGCQQNDRSLAGTATT